LSDLPKDAPGSPVYSFILASFEPWELANIGSIGPLPPDENGNIYIIVIVCCFTRWVEQYPVKDASAKEAAKVLFTHCGRFSYPSTIRSDNGSQFVNAVIAELLLLLGINHELITPYSHEENGIVERMNKEVMRHLRDICLDKRATDIWGSHCLPFVQRILNSQEKTSTGVSPAELLFGSTVSLGRERLPSQRLPSKI
jgi:transposase InsO family protein